MIDHMGLRGRLAAFILTGGFVAILALAGATFAQPEETAAEQASCMGHEASAISPPGSSTEFPGGMPQLREVVEQEFPELTYAEAVTILAKLHEGSHEACDAALAPDE